MVILKGLFTLSPIAPLYLDTPAATPAGTQQPHQQPHQRTHQQPHQQPHQRTHQRTHQQPHQRTHQQPHQRAHQQTHQQPHQRTHSGHTNAHTSGHTNAHQDNRRTRPTPGHISPPDGPQLGRVRRSEAPGFLRDSGKNPLFQLRIIRLLTNLERNTKKATGLRPIAFNK